jgi:serine/threonine-protein kinase
MGSLKENRPRRVAAETAQLDRDSASVIVNTRDAATLYQRGDLLDDRYRLEREIGRGGMGVVWIAHSLVLGIDVALKLIRSTETGPEGASRMAREAHAAARVGHPALVRVYDFGWTPHGDPYLVMELIRGEALSDWIVREQRISALKAVQTLLPIADGLRLAHERGIVHRDIKPGNILLSKESPNRPQPKLLDFGIAKIGQGVEGKLTQVGTVLGSPEYMSPEQALGLDDIDRRSDVWSFCVALYEMITGQVPFKGANYNALMQVIIRDAPVPTMQYAAGDPELWRILERGLAKSRDERWANMSELGNALAHWLYGHGIKEDISGNSLRAVWRGEGALQLESTTPPRASSLAPPEPVTSVHTVFHPGLVGRAKRWLTARRRPVFLLLGLASFLALASIWGARKQASDSRALAPEPGLPARPQAAGAAAAAQAPPGSPAELAAPAQDTSPRDSSAGHPQRSTPLPLPLTASEKAAKSSPPAASNSDTRNSTRPARNGRKTTTSKPKAKRDFGF